MDLNLTLNAAASSGEPTTLFDLYAEWQYGGKSSVVWQRMEAEVQRLARASAAFAGAIEDGEERLADLRERFGARW